MEPYRYCVSLRISHPVIDPQEITNTLKLEAFSQWKVGDVNATYKGRTLSGVRKESYWTHHPHGEDKISSDTLYLEDYLEKLTIQLNPYKEYFANIVETGGNINYFVGIFSERNIGHSFSASLLKNISNLSIDLELDIYAYSEKTHKKSLNQDATYVAPVT